LIWRQSTRRDERRVGDRNVLGVCPRELLSAIFATWTPVSRVLRTTPPTMPVPMLMSTVP
jgi:hypothetical protein